MWIKNYTFAIPLENMENTKEEEEELKDASVTDLLTDSQDNDLEDHESEEDKDVSKTDPLLKEDFSSLSKQELAKKSEDIVHYPDTRVANEVFQKLRNYLDEILRKDREVLIGEWVKEGNDARDFIAPADDAKDEFYQNFQRFQDRRKEERDRAQKEREKNLKAKQEILDKIKQLVESEETENSLQELRELQREWKHIRQVPREQMNHLWDTYRFYLDRFYDNLTINNELKDLDRQKNLETKIELCLKVEALKTNKSVKKSLILLNKYHEDFKNTGPVPKEATEEIWLRFKGVSDEVMELKKDELAKIKDSRNENLKAKVLLCEKAEQKAEIPYEKISEWNKATKEVNELFEEWKGVGMAPKSQNDLVWKRFRDARDVFFKNKKAFFARLNDQREGNLEKKEEICKLAESLKDSQDWSSTTKELIELQAKWKEIGPVPEKHSKAIWERFRAACDHFFNAKDMAFKGRKEEELENLNNKLDLIGEVKALLESGTEDNVLQSLKEINTKWNTVGFVPFKKKDKVYKDYQAAVDSVYAKFNKSRAEARGERMRGHYNELASSDNAEKKLKDELRRLNGKMRGLEEELKTLENNIAFFSSSKGSEKLLKPFQDKISKTQALLEKLREEKKYINSQIKKLNG